MSATPQWTLHYFDVRDAVAHYDYLGGLGNDRLARRVAAEALAHDIGLDYIQATELLADALARRAASRQRS